MSDERMKRAQARRNWPGRITDLDGQDDAALVEGGTAQERIAMVWRVTLNAWAMSGRELPSYDRANMPGRIIRAGK